MVADKVLRIEVGVHDEGGSTVWPPEYRTYVLVQDARRGFEVALAKLDRYMEHPTSFRTTIADDFDE